MVTTLQVTERAPSARKFVNPFISRGLPDMNSSTNFHATATSAADPSCTQRLTVLKPALPIDESGLFFDRAELR